MHKLFKFLFILPMILLLAACDDSTPKGENGGIIWGGNYERLCNHNYYVTYLRDVDTDIIYVLYDGSKRGSLSVYYAEDGKPMSYDEFKIVHNSKYH